MNRALVTGASGFIGTHLVTHLRSEGWQVETAAHDCLERGLALEGIATVFHLAGLAHAGAKVSDRPRMFAANVALSTALYQRACDAGVGRFIWLSSSKVLGDTSSAPLTETAPYKPGDLYAESKMAAEQALLEMSCLNTRLCVVRPPLVYGVGVGANFLSLLRAAVSAWPLPFASALAQRSWLSVNNLTDFLHTLACVDELGEQKIFHVRDAADASVAQMLTRLRALNDSSPKLWPLNPRVGMMLGALLGRRDMVSRLFLPFQLDMQTTQKTLAWAPPLPQMNELVQVLEWHKA